MAAADSKAVDHGNDGLGQAAYLLLHIEHVETRHTVAADIAAAALDVHIAACTEGFVACAGQDDHADVLRLAAIAEGIADFGCGQRREGVAITGAIDGDTGNAVVGIKEDFFILLQGSPGSC